MSIVRFTVQTLGFVILSLAFTSLAQAQATRTWVSGVGDDVNPCSRTAPCKTFAGAISKTAINGEIDALDPGGFGAVTVTKSITISGTGTFASILASGTTGVIINIAPNVNDPLRTVRLRGLSINGAGVSGAIGTRTGINGVRIDQALAVFVEDTVISDFSQFGILDQRTTSGKLLVNNIMVRNNGGSGIAVAPSSGATTIAASINGSQLVGNGNAGLSVVNGSRVTISNCVISGNTSFGFFSSGPMGAAELNAENCILSGNGTGIRTDAGGTIRISNLHITNNGTGISAIGGSVLSYGNNHNSGNTANGAPTATVQPPNPV